MQSTDIHNPHTFASTLDRETLMFVTNFRLNRDCYEIQIQADRSDPGTHQIWPL